MSLAKHFFARLRDSPTEPYHAWFHALSEMWYARLSTCWLEICWWNLVVQLLLLAGELWLASGLPFSSWFSSWRLSFSSWMTACSSPPGVAADCLPFSS
jgi:hypothetical protein